MKIEHHFVGRESCPSESNMFKLFVEKTSFPSENNMVKTMLKLNVHFVAVSCCHFSKPREIETHQFIMAEVRNARKFLNQIERPKMKETRAADFVLAYAMKMHMNIPQMHRPVNLP